MDNNNTPKKRRYIFDILFLLVLVAATFWLIFSQSELDDIGRALKHTDFKWLIPAAGMVFVCIFCEGFNYMVVLGELGTRITARRSMTYAAIDLYFCAITPSASGGQPAATYYMAKDGVSVANSSAAILFFTLQCKIINFLYLAVVLIFRPLFVTTQSLAFRIMLVAGICVSFLLMLFITIAMLKPVIVEKLVSVLCRLLSALKLIKRSQKTAERFRHVGLDFKVAAKELCGKKRVFFKSLLFCFFQRTALFSVVWFIYRALGFSQLDFLTVISCQVLLSVAVDFIPLPGAIGATEMSFLHVFRGIFPQAALLPAMLMTRMCNFYLCLIVCAVITLSNIIRLSVRQNHANTALHEKSSAGDEIIDEKDNNDDRLL
ncbi:MAG TPA: lysylphosphatidylglycerol synthase transmembrane domain-containing protein [Bacillota bacterium]|nr:lysylphosphatidylglycerol synthase transmembrane domain-containing protein [Bacillota bacterium]